RRALKVAHTIPSVAPVGAALTRTMEKIHEGRGIAIDLDPPADVRFRGERQDLEEMVGNLIDNACKWAQMRVSVEVVAERRDGAAIVRIIIDDDGPGLSPAQRDQVARRGLRLDETKPGFGLGLSIVRELAALYGGNLQLGNAPIGGLRAELVLPAVLRTLAQNPDCRARPHPISPAGRTPLPVWSTKAGSRAPNYVAWPTLGEPESQRATTFCLFA